MRKSLLINRIRLIFFALILCTGYAVSQAQGDATATSGPASGPSPVAASASPSANPASLTGLRAAPAIDSRVREVLNKACAQLSSATTLTYHAEITFDSVLSSGVKIQYAGALDTAIQRPDHLTINYKSDLGAKVIWYDG
ncbi:MAG: DUF2092 domain-containing protein, partial [Deltaproteobacteria bacterium]|nr:DUF2092 domain-containing protein [Deltaproteobacteria bacterium]